MADKIHPQIKLTLGYEVSISDKEFKKDWKNKSTQVCKPCWELKYCPYGPFIEQSPILPPLKQESILHNEYLKTCLNSNTYGGVLKLDSEGLKYQKERLKEAKKDVKILLQNVLREINHDELIAESEEKGLSLNEVYPTPYGNFEKYKVPFPLTDDEPRHKKIEITDEIQKLLDNELLRLEKIVESGEIDGRKRLDNVRRKWFEEQVNAFNPDDYPKSIPVFVNELSCNIFGHICPVVFVGESITETSENRRKGRYISFKTKIRVVRRDNYTCQECGTHLKDDEVEFDHIIPVAKGGSSEEHNIRLTCYDCNRDKSDSIKI